MPFVLNKTVPISRLWEDFADRDREAEICKTTYPCPSGFGTLVSQYYGRLRYYACIGRDDFAVCTVNSGGVTPIDFRPDPESARRRMYDLAGQRYDF